MYVRTAPYVGITPPPCSVEHILVYTVVWGCCNEYAAAYVGMTLPRI